jgi:hypothetical protein
MWARIFSLAAVWSFTAAAQTIWIEERVQLGASVRLSLSREVRRLADERPVSLIFSSQSARPPGEVIAVSVRATAPRRYPQALGLALRAGDRIEPMIELYVQPVMRTLGGAAGPEEVGRALARVLTHELIHLTTQRCDHDGAGLFAASMGQRDLTKPVLPR